MDITIEELLAATKGKLSIPHKHELLRQPIREITTDSRSTMPGDCFVALSGDKHDGHQFLGDATKRGARVVIINQAYPANNLHSPAIRVPCTLKAIEQIACYHRRRFSPVIVGITGSLGKTTTKDLLYQIITTERQVLRSPKSFNNNLGVPLTLLKLHSTHQIAIFEIGANAPGEVAHLSKIVKPHIGVITCIAHTHLQGFQNIQGVEQAKSELLLGMDEDSVLITNGDDAACMRIAQEFTGRVVTFGCLQADMCAKGIQSTACGFQFECNRQKYSVNIPGTHNIYNLLAAMCVARELGISHATISRCLPQLKLPAMRMEVHNVGDITVINDSYNASPKAVFAALAFLQRYAKRRKIAVLGSMLELGVQSHQLHYEIGLKLAKRVDWLLTIGAEARAFAEGALAGGMHQNRILQMESVEQVSNSLLFLLRKQDVVLLKASRKLALENLLARIAAS